MNPLDQLWQYLDNHDITLPRWLFDPVVIIPALTVAVGYLKPVRALVATVWRVGKLAVTWHSHEERRQRRRRRMFAEHLDNELRSLELQEDWRDDKYAELEAEVEIERSRRLRWRQWVLPFRRPALLRMRSLSAALGRNRESLILLEGEPGAGKSVALRHLARRRLRKARRRRLRRGVIPLYINLRSLSVRPEDVSSNDIHEFVLRVLGEANSTDIDDVLEKQFDRGLSEGYWLFLFDSFDEIPDILSAQDTRPVAARYARAIADFLGPFTRCRGVVASRDFSSPEIPQFSRFRILRLGRAQQLHLVRKADLDRPVTRALRDGLASASQDVAVFAGNPMFLGLLCEHMRSGATFPTSSHTVFEEYLTHRLRRDTDRIRTRFRVDPGFIRAGAQEIAFLLASTPRIGLEPTRTVLRRNTGALQGIGPAMLDTILDALEFIKLGRADRNADGETTFSFVHRRFQEYFATCVVIRDASRVPVTALIDNDQWRETAVTLLQVQHDSATRSLMDEARRRMRRYATEVASDNATEPFHWPPGCQHLLGILATGLETHQEKVDGELSDAVDTILTRAWDAGHRLEKRRALAYLNVAGDAVAEQLLIEAFRSGNEFLREGAFAAAGSLSQLREGPREQIRLTLLGLAGTPGLYFKRASVVAQIKRLAQPREFLQIVRLLTIGVPAGVLLSFVVPVAGVASALEGSIAEWMMFIVLFVAVWWAGLVVLLKLFKFAAPRRGGPLAQPMSPDRALLNHVVRFGTVGTLLLVNGIFCAMPLVLLHNSHDAVPLWVIVLWGGFGALWPAGLIWACRTTIGARLLFWPVLPLMMATVGLARLPKWFRNQTAQYRRTSAEARAAAWRELRKRMLRDSWFIAVYLLSMFGSPALMFGVIEFASATGHENAIVAPVLLLYLSVGFFALYLVCFVTGVQLRRRVSGANSAESLLALMAQARSDTAISALLGRFAARRVCGDPAVRDALERLVGEIESAQRQAEGHRDMTIWQTCPSLGRHRVVRHRVVDALPLVRSYASLRVRDLSEETIDELARIAAQE